MDTSAIAARWPYRLLAALFALLGATACLGAGRAILTEHPSAVDVALISPMIAGCAIGTIAAGFVAIKGRGPLWLLRFRRPSAR
jgi:hypothetical protein